MNFNKPKPQNTPQHKQKIHFSCQPQKIMSEEELILLVKDRPILYDRKNPEYRQIEIKEGIWKGIAEKLNISGKSKK